jgi:DNA-binding beta-propeller fold protein YncE
MGIGGMHEIRGDHFARIAFLRTGKGVHGPLVSLDSRFRYVSNRGERSIPVIDFAKRKVIKKWRVPHGGSPDMGGISADGKVMWIFARNDSKVYAFAINEGKLVARIGVGKGPHGLCVCPQPGRYSLGHTGLFR